MCSYSQFFHTMAQIAPVILDAPIPNATILPSGNNVSAPLLC